MKTENQMIKKVKMGMVISFFALAGAASAVANDGNSLKSVGNLNDESLSLSADLKRATLRVEDTKVMLGLSVRTPTMEDGSGVNNNESKAGFVMNLSAKDVEKISSRIEQIEAERAELAKKLETEEKKQAAALKNERKKIQLARMNSVAGESAEVSRNLFNSLIQESVIETKAQAELAMFDELNTINIEFFEINGSRVVANFSIAGETLWETSSSNLVALNKK